LPILQLPCLGASILIGTNCLPAATKTAGQSPAEQFIPIRPDHSIKPIMPGEELYWQSAQTNKFCRVVEVAGQGRVQCDLDSPEGAARMTYTGKCQRRGNAS
jgi:hypothetical protein